MKHQPVVCLGPRNNPLKIGDYPDYDPHPAPIHNHGSGGLQSLTDCLVIIYLPCKAKRQYLLTL